MKHRLLSALLIMSLISMSGCGKAKADTDNIYNDDTKDTTATTVSNPGDEITEDTALPITTIDDKYRTTYEVFVYSFYDSDGDGIGDLNGLKQKLDYINDGDASTDSDLGCNEIWLMPISPSPTYHKYDVTDYMNIDEQYGTMDDFDALVKECHDRGVNVIIDLVLNHTSSEHPWFTSARDYLVKNPQTIEENGAEKTGDNADNENADAGIKNIQWDDSSLSDCPYLEYYNFSSEKMDGYEPLEGTDIFYEARFWSGMPDLNLDSDSVRKEITDITGFWIDHGVDGFRLDAVTSYYTGDDLQNIDFMTWLSDTINSQKSDAYIVGEAWTNSATYHKYYASGIDSFFDFDYAGSEGIIAATVKGSSPAKRFGSALMNTEKSLQEAASKEDKTGNTGSDLIPIDAPFYTNHDMARSCGYYVGKNAQDRIKMAGALNLLMGGNAFIYYGEELGMKGSGKDENKRAPMYWSEDKNSTGMCKGPGAMDSFKMKYPSLEEQEKDPYSIYNYYKAAIKMRNTFPLIARGKTKLCEELSDESICAFFKKSAEGTISEGAAQGGEILIVFNTATEPRSVTLSDSADAVSFNRVMYQLNTGEDAVSTENGVIVLPPYSIAVLSD